MSQELANELSKKFTELTKIKCEAKYFEKGEKHIPTKLDENKKGVYVFFLNENVCFKVGKANSNSQARWNSHHYNLDRTTPSTLTKSILSHLTRLKEYFNNEEINKFEVILEKYNLNEKNIRKEIKAMEQENVNKMSIELNLKEWIENNIHRIEFVLDNTNDEIDFDTNLLEALIQFELKPIFEGKES